jgi:polysaccharide biosynthesis protein PslA
VQMKTATAWPLANRKADSSFVRMTVYSTCLGLEIILLAISFLLAGIIRHGGTYTSVNLEWTLLLIPIYVVVAFYVGVYNHEAIQSFKVSTKRTIIAFSWAVAIVLLSFFLTKATDALSRTTFFLGSFLALALLLPSRLGVILLVRRTLHHRFLRRVFIVDGVPARQLAGYDNFSAEQLGIKLNLHDPEALHAFSTIVRDYDRILVDCRVEDREKWSLYLQAVGCIGFMLIPELQPIVSDHARLNLEAASIRVSTGPLDLRCRIIKRMFDLGLGFTLCLIVAPLLIITAIAIKLDSPGTVLFKQVRMGRCNRLFYVLKFRSMRSDLADPTGNRSAAKDDERITRVGRFIRATSIDELPQLFNVLRGDMSLVGPRPHALGSRAGEDLFWQVDVRYWLRHTTKPGITGLAQIRGYRGATDTTEHLKDRLRCDLEYVRNWSIIRDITIMLATFGVVVHKNAY